MLAGVLAVQTVICNKITEITSNIIAKKNAPRSWTVVDQALPHSTHTMPLSRTCKLYNYSQRILTLVWRSECDGLRCELLIKIPGVCL